MKKFVLNYCLKIIKQNNSDISEVKLEEIKYGLEGIYLTLTKTIFIFLITYVLGIFKEMIIMLFTFNILRTTGFGMHAKYSWQCWISSIIFFIICPFIAQYIVIPIYIKILLCSLAITLIFIYSPADTIKHPLINHKKRMLWKYITTINTIILVFISLFLNNNISNLVVFGIYIEVILINPITYKLFKLPYNNYKRYNLNTN